MIFILGCNNNSNQTICNSPYIQIGNECCLDKDNNKICDQDEVDKQSASKETVPSSNGIIEVVCPKEVGFATGEDSSKDVNFTVNYVGLGRSAFYVSTICDGQYVSIVPHQFVIGEGEYINVKVRLNVDYNNVCEFLVTETNTAKKVSCNSTVVKTII